MKKEYVPKPLKWQMELKLKWTSCVPSEVPHAVPESVQSESFW